MQMEIQDDRAGAARARPEICVMAGCFRGGITITGATQGFRNGCSAPAISANGAEVSST